MSDPKILLDAFNLAPEEAVKYFEKKGYVIPSDWQAMSHEARAKAFTVAGVAKMDILTDIGGMVQQALKDGMTERDFAKELTPRLIAKGWWGSKKVDGHDGETVVQMGSPWRLRTIYNTNLQTAYSVGRYKGQIDNAEEMPYWKYVAIMDSATRPEHAKLNDLIFPVDDPFWDVFYPPNGYNCRCSVQALSQIDVDKQKLNVRSSDGHLKNSAYIDPQHNTTITPDEGWDFNPGEVAFEPDLEKYDPDLRQAYQDEIKSQTDENQPSAGLDENQSRDTESSIETSLSDIQEKYPEILPDFQKVTVEPRESGHLMGVDLEKKELVLSSVTETFPGFPDYNPARELSQALDKIKNKLDLTANEELAIAGLKHESLHFEVKEPEPPPSTRRELIDTAIEFVARKTYPALISDLGGADALFQEKILNQAPGYGAWVNRFRKILEQAQIDEDEITPKLFEALFTTKAKDINVQLAKVLKMSSKNQPKNGFKPLLLTLTWDEQQSFDALMKEAFR